MLFDKLKKENKRKYTYLQGLLTFMQCSNQYWWKHQLTFTNWNTKELTIQNTPKFHSRNMSVINFYLLHYDTELLLFNHVITYCWINYDCIMIKKYFLESENVKGSNIYHFDEVRVSNAVTFIILWYKKWKCYFIQH